MAASGDVRVGDETGRPSGGVETALPHTAGWTPEGDAIVVDEEEEFPPLLARRRSVQPVHGAVGCLTARTNNMPSQHAAV